MSPHLRVRTVLVTRLARFAAAVIIVLGISPFTAPFSTFDPAEILSEQVLHAGASQVKAVQDISECLLVSAGTSPLMLDVIVDGLRVADLLSIRPVRVVVLRI